MPLFTVVACYIKCSLILSTQCQATSSRNSITLFLAIELPKYKSENAKTTNTNTKYSVTPPYPSDIDGLKTELQSLSAEQHQGQAEIL